MSAQISRQRLRSGEQFFYKIRSSFRGISNQVFDEFNHRFYLRSSKLIQALRLMLFQELGNFEKLA